MKRLILLLFATLLFSSLQAQNWSREGKGKKEKIEEIITDLSPQQKSRIDAITQRSAKNIEHYRTQLDAVRDSIRRYMGLREDHSSVVFRLYDREGRLRSEMSKEYYRTKVAIDAVLTPEQFRRFQEQMADKSTKHAPQTAPAKKRQQRKSK